MTGSGAAAPPRVLVLRALGLGDLCTAVPALRALARAFHDHQIVLAAPSWQTPLARLAGIARVTPARALGPLSGREAGPAVAVNLHGRGPQSTRRLLELGPRRLIAFRHPVLPVTDDQPRWSPHEHDAARWCRLLAAHEIHADPAELSLDVPDIASPVTHGAVIVHPGAGATARRWPADRFVAVVRELLARGERVVVTGDRSEVELADHVTRQASVGESSVGEASVGEATVLPTDRTTTDQLTAGQVTNVAGRTSLLELCALVAGARAMVCNDTGVAHLASAYRVPSVVLFGPTPPAEWGPPPGPHIAIWKGTRGDPYAEAVHPGLAAITVREVIEAFEAVTLIPRGGGHAVRFGNDRLGEDVTTQQRAPERWRREPPVNPRQEPP